MRNRRSLIASASTGLAPRTVWLLFLCLTTPVLLYTDEPDSTVTEPAPVKSVTEPQTAPANPSSTTAGPESEPDPKASVQPYSFLSWDSDGNVRQQYKVESDLSVGHHARIGLMFGQNFVRNVLVSGPSGSSQGYADAGLTGQWRPNELLKFDGMFGASQVRGVAAEGESVSAVLIPITNLLAHFTPAGDAVVIDAGFNRSVYGLSPQLVINRIVRNEFVVHPQVGLPSGWRFRELAEMGPMTGAGESNARYNSELTVARGLGENSELYWSYDYLHYAKATDAGYYSPDQVQAFEAGWSIDVKRRAVSASLDFAAGTGHSKEHQQAYGPWGLSLRAQADLTWTIRPGRELHASYEYDYNQFNPAVETSTPKPWSMTALTVFFRWAKK